MSAVPLLLWLRGASLHCGPALGSGSGGMAVSRRDWVLLEVQDEEASIITSDCAQRGELLRRGRFGACHRASAPCSGKWQQRGSETRNGEGKLDPGTPQPFPKCTEKLSGDRPAFET